MNMDIDHGVWTLTQDGETRSRPDWRALRARLGAAHAARQTLGEGDSATAFGSFESGSAAALARYAASLADVNPDALVNRKRGNGKDTVAAGNQLSGSRG